MRSLFSALNLHGHTIIHVIKFAPHFSLTYSIPNPCVLKIFQELIFTEDDGHLMTAFVETFCIEKYSFVGLRLVKWLTSLLLPVLERQKKSPSTTRERKEDCVYWSFDNIETIWLFTIVEIYISCIVLGSWRWRWRIQHELSGRHKETTMLYILVSFFVNRQRHLNIFVVSTAAQLVSHQEICMPKIH